MTLFEILQDLNRLADSSLVWSQKEVDLVNSTLYFEDGNYIRFDAEDTDIEMGFNPYIGDYDYDC